MEKVFKFLSEIGVDPETIKALTTDEAPEGFEIDQAVQGYVSKRKELLLNNKETMQEIKQRLNAEIYPAISKPVLAELKRLTGLSNEELEALKDEGDPLPPLKKAIAAGVSKLQSTGAVQVDEWKEKVFNLQSELEKAKEVYEGHISEVKSTYEQRLVSRDIQQQFSKLMNDVPIIPGLKREAAEKLLYDTISSDYKLQLTDNGLDVLTKDGTKVDDGKNFLSVQDVVKKRAEEFGILQKSNGGAEPSRGAVSDPRTVQTSSELSPRAKAMLERAKK